MTAQETAKYLGISHAMVRWYLRNKKLKGRQIGQIWLIEKKDADSFKKILNARPK